MNIVPTEFSTAVYIIILCLTQILCSNIINLFKKIILQLFYVDKFPVGWGMWGGDTKLF